MNQKDAYEHICGEYLRKCKACDECIAQTFCILNGLRTDRVPQKGCEEKLKRYLKERKL